jgi:hypothetical protein
VGELTDEQKEEVVKQQRNVRMEALKRVGWVKDTPPVTGNGKKIFSLAFPEGGFEEVISSYVPHLAEFDDRYLTLIEKYWDASKFDRERLHPEDWLAVVGISLSEFLGEVTRITVTLNQTAGALIAAAAQPAVISASVERAKDPKAGLQDRQMLFKATGFLPTPKGHTINIGGVPQPQQGQVQESGSQLMLGPGQAPEANVKEEPFEDFARAASKRMREQQSAMIEDTAEEAEFEEVE